MFKIFKKNPNINKQSLTDQIEYPTDQNYDTKAQRSKKSEKQQQNEPTPTHDLAASGLVKN